MVALCNMADHNIFTRYNALHCEFMNTPHVEFLNVPVCSAPMSFLAGNGVVRSALVLAARMRCLRRTHSNGRVCRVHTCVMAIGADFKMYLLRQFCSNRVYFYNTQETQTQNNGGPEFWNWNSVIFENFFEIFKKAPRGPSAADLHHYGRGQTRSE